MFHASCQLKSQPQQAQTEPCVPQHCGISSRHLTLLSPLFLSQPRGFDELITQLWTFHLRVHAKATGLL